VKDFRPPDWLIEYYSKEAKDQELRTDPLAQQLRDFANQVDLTTQQAEHLREAASAISILDEALNAAIQDRDEIYEVVRVLKEKHEEAVQSLAALTKLVEEIRGGFEGCCHACEPVGAQNQILRKERDEALKKIDELQDVCGDSADRMVELRKERDEARRMWCEAESVGNCLSVDDMYRRARAEAKRREWDCFKEEAANEGGHS